MKTSTAPFFERVDVAMQNHFMRQAVRSAQDNLYNRRLQAAEELGSWEEWRNAAEQIRQHTLENLDYYLWQLSENVEKAGGHVFFAQDAQEATAYIQDVVKKRQGKRIIKSKSMVTEEIDLNRALEEIGCTVRETDLAEFILQTDDHDAPSHIVVPSLHKDRERICEVFARKLGYQGTSQPEEMARFVRQQLRPEFLAADVGITGCNFAVAESGTVTIVANEGNERLCTSLPQTLITVMGMERIVPTWEDLDILVSLLCRSAVGQKLTSYLTCLTGPKAGNEGDGPEEFHLVIVDNGRSQILGSEFQSVLQCIRCGACINVCPVYRQIGGHAYGSIYPGPIGAVLSPLLGGYDDYKELPFASSLCAACSEACPVKIPLHQLLIQHRRQIVEEEGYASLGEQLAIKGYALAARFPRLYEMGSQAAPLVLKPFTKGDKISDGPGPIRAWTEGREFPPPSRQTFRSWFKHQKRGDF